MNKIRRIMIADDDPAIIDSMTIMLEFEGYEVSTTANGSDLLKIDAPLPDVLLLDIWMSGIDGRDICRTLKRQEDTKKMPIVLFSASKDIEQSALAAGANDFISKPFELEELVKVVEKQLATADIA